MAYPQWHPCSPQCAAVTGFVPANHSGTKAQREIVRWRIVVAPVCQRPTRPQIHLTPFSFWSRALSRSAEPGLGDRCSTIGGAAKSAGDLTPPCHQWWAALFVNGLGEPMSRTNRGALSLSSHPGLRNFHIIGRDPFTPIGKATNGRHRHLRTSAMLRKRPASPHLARASRSNARPRSRL